MKEIRIMLEDAEYKTLSEIKERKNLTWKQLLMRTEL